MILAAAWRLRSCSCHTFNGAMSLLWRKRKKSLRSVYTNNEIVSRDMRWRQLEKFLLLSLDVARHAAKQLRKFSIFVTQCRATQFHCYVYPFKSYFKIILHCLATEKVWLCGLGFYSIDNSCAKLCSSWLQPVSYKLYLFK
jgi:hypothetical protein